MDSVQNSASVSTLLGVLFIALKLTHVIAWSWVWVLAPFWISAAFAALVVLIALIWVLVSDS